MKNKFISFLFVILICSCQKKSAKKVSTITDSLVVDVIPFKLTKHNNIVVQAILNKTDTLHLMFHTAVNSVSVTSSASKTIKNIEWDTTTEVKSWGGKTNSRFSQTNSLKIGNIQYNTVEIWENEKSGHNTDGKFGLNFFKEYVVALNFDKNEIRLYNSLPKEVSSYFKQQLVNKDGLLFINATSKIGEEEYDNQFLIHTGYEGTVLYDDKFSSENAIGKQIDITSESELKDSYGNVLKTKKGELPEFTIANETFKKLPVGFFEGAIGRQNISIIGGDLIKRFNVFFDTNRKAIYLKTNSLKDVEYQY